MTWLFPVLLVAIVLVCLAMLQAEGLWGNILNFIATIWAALVATNFWEPLASLLDAQLPEYTYFWDFLSLWAIFAVSLGIMRQLNTMISRVRVRFRKPVEVVGNYFFAVATGWVLICFTVMTLHTAPLGRSPFFGGFQRNERMFYGTAPDRAWLNFMQAMSLKGLSRGGTEAHVFDPNADFILRYEGRSAKLESEKAFRVGGG